jgi:hypothetical protein
MMRLPSKFVPASLLFAIALSPLVLAQSPSAGLNALPEVELSRLSQRDPNPLGEKALTIHPEQWRHGETQHFIYHFVDSFVVTPLSVEAEFHYRVVVKELQREPPAGVAHLHFSTAGRLAAISNDWKARAVDRWSPFAGEPFYSARARLQIQRQRSGA